MARERPNLADRPNVVVIVSDTLRRDHLGVYGNDWIRTPALDRLAERAVVFDNHHVGSFPTMPARADLLTGRLSMSFMTWAPLPTGIPTLPGLLSEAGYLTMGVVDTPFYIRDGFGYDRGFQDFIWIRGQGDGRRMEERVDARSTWLHESDRWVARTVTAAEEWLERHFRERFFLLVDVWDPHEPWDAPDYYTQLYAPDYDGRATDPCYDNWREAGLSEDDVRLAHATYCGEITMVDRWVGRLLEKLDVLGIADDTVLFFVSDHGYYFGEHGYLGKSVWDPGLGTQSWSPLYREIVQTPLLVQGPGFAPRRTQALSTLVDLPATVLELAGVEPPDGLAGRSLAPVLRGETDTHRELVISGWPLEYQKGRISIAVDSWPRRIAHDQPFTVTTRDRSLVVGGPEDDLELYDLLDDPAEARNLALERPDEAVAILEEALAYLLSIGTAEELLAPRRGALERFQAAVAQPVTTSAAHPNVVVVVADDLGYGDLGLFNDGRCNSPHLDALAGAGICLTQHYSGSPVCAPARASLLTGRYPHRTGAIDTLQGRGLDRIALAETTIADHFRSAGYRTGLVGKWHNGAIDPRYHPNARGFDEFAGFSGGFSDYYDYSLDVNGSDVAGDGRYLTDVLTEHAVSFVRRNVRQPFFLLVAYNAPHFPMQAPQELVDGYLARGETLGAALTYAMIEVMDAGVGQIDETLHELGLAENTIVLFTSDNGPYLGAWEGISLDRFNYGWRGAKHYVFEGGIRVPAIVRWPDRLGGGRIVPEMLHFTDWLPTLAAAAGVRLPGTDRLDGSDIGGVLAGDRSDVDPVRFWQNNRYAPRAEGNAAMRDGDWKLVRPTIPVTMQVTDGDRVIDRALNLQQPDRITHVDESPLPWFEIGEPPAPLLFDVAADPFEQDDLAAAHPERVARMSAALDRWFESVEADRAAIADVW